MKPPSALAALAAAFCLAVAARAADSEALAPLRAELRAEHYDPAIALAEQLIAANAPGADEASYLKALAHFNAKKFPDAITAAEQLATAFPQSIWRFKATFLKAQSLVEQKDFKAATVLYQAEVVRLLAADRKQDLVGIIVAFADKLTATPDPNLPDAPKPDFQKAYNLYTKALGMEISREYRDELLFKKARAIQQVPNPGQAIQDFQAYLTEFDPSWTGPAGSGTARLPMQNPPLAGKHVAMAHFRLAEAQIQSGNLAAGRMELEDLLKRINAPTDRILPIHAELATDDGIKLAIDTKPPTGLGKKLSSEIRWLTVQSYFAQPPATAFNINTTIGQTSQAIGNTGGLPTTDVTLYAVRDGDLDAKRSKPAATI